jgi:arginase
MIQATLLGVPLDLGAKNLGVDVGPEAFRYQKIIEKLTQAGIDITDAGNVTVAARADLKARDPKLRYLDEIVRVSKELATATATTISKQRRMIALGGDHSINLGVVSGAAKALDGDLGLIYLDAHGDMNTPETTLTGNIHGMHLAALLGFGPEDLTTVSGPSPTIATNNLLHIGGCDFDQAELDLVAHEKLHTFSMRDVLSYGLAPLFKQIDELKSRVSNIWISLDLDCIDAVYAPGAGMPNKRGLTYREIVTIAEYIGQECPVVGIDVVEYNPLQDVDHKTAELGIELIAKFLGTDYSWYTNYLQRNDINAS